LHGDGDRNDQGNPGNQLGRPGAHPGGGDLLAVDGMWDADDRDVEHSRMAEQRLFHLDGGDVLTGGNHDVLRSVHQLDVSVRVHHAEIP